MEVKQKVNELIRLYKTSDPFELAECCDITLWDNKSLGGLYANYVKYEDKQFIMVDKDTTPPERWNFVCAHELGHALFTPDANTQWMRQYKIGTNADRVEYLANQFAVELLLNDEFLKENEGISIYTLADSVGVPQKFVSLKKM